MLDRSTMFHARRCCISVDTATFIFAVFSAVISGFGTVVFATARTWFATVTGDENFEHIYDRDPDEVRMSVGDKIYEQRVMDYAAVMISMLFFFFCCLVSFIFSVFLCYGTHKRRPGFVKAYLVYGVIVTILMMAGAVLYSWIMEDIVGGSVVLIACGIYSFLLLMVQRTYEVIRAEKTRDSAQLLCPEPCIKG